eukprot:CAMPEP_0177468278 /NCGR_PEP_ID=MMETSP0369-20130122/18981_1 /TAXON_ID=447022 ORGANISM="Scrippsiella hangoei-like, Strain SHHI-4" /NCGR_SAMPLE_ID=MMETSP0369 /ASSEMBLY_ACC=CAM_ASM_000364 /LENGTH=223 /DNA_ID=CAMNT_0018942457 /DNA_START=195 /DNA_END=864 /DNA_ORIENTATION=-
MPQHQEIRNVRFDLHIGTRRTLLQHGVQPNDLARSHFRNLHAPDADGQPPVPNDEHSTVLLTLLDQQRTPAREDLLPEDKPLDDVRVHAIEQEATLLQHPPEVDLACEAFILGEKSSSWSNEYSRMSVVRFSGSRPTGSASHKTSARRPILGAQRAPPPGLPERHSAALEGPPAANKPPPMAAMQHRPPPAKNAISMGRASDKGGGLGKWRAPAQPLELPPLR